MLKLVPVAIGLFIRSIEHDGFDIWMQVRNEDGPLNGLWEFPGGKIEAGETAFKAVRRELIEEVDCDIEFSPTVLFKLFPYQYKDRMICLYPHLICHETGPDQKFGKWFRLSFTDKSLPIKEIIPTANLVVIDELCDYLKKLVSTETLDYLWTL